MQEINKEALKIDMATISKCFKEFYGREDEDVFAWIKASTVTARINNLSPQAQLHFLVNNLRGKAQDWLSCIVNDVEKWTLDEFIRRIKERFPTVELETRMMNRFLKTTCVKSKKEFISLLEDAASIGERGLINTNSLIKQFITRCPVEIRPYLLNTIKTAASWEIFAKEAE